MHRVTDATWLALELFDLHAAFGALPDAGGLFDQSAWLVAAFGIIRDTRGATTPDK